MRRVLDRLESRLGHADRSSMTSPQNLLISLCQKLCVSKVCHKVFDTVTMRSFDNVKNFVTHFVTPEIWTLTKGTLLGREYFAI